MHSVAHEHRAQFFDSTASLVTEVAAFVRDGLVNGESVLLVTTERHRNAVRARCDGDVDLEAARAQGWLTVLDAELVVEQLLRSSEPTWDVFDAEVGTLVRRLNRDGRRLRIFGEAVDVLVRRNRFDAAAVLEGFWNRLASTEPFELFCGYSAEHFGNPRDAASFRRICGLHSYVHAAPADVLGSFLLKTYRAC